MADIDQKLSPRREHFRFSRASRNQKAVSSNVMDAIKQFSSGEEAEGGKMKILVRKEDLKHVLEAIRSSEVRGGSVRRVSNPTALSLEQRLNWMRRRQIIRAACRGRSRLQGSWRPVLQSIPEEI